MFTHKDDMKFYRELDKLTVGCQHCKALKSATMKVRDVEFSHTPGVAKDVLVAVCDTCDNVASIPQQSTIRVAKELQKAKKSIELRVPAHYLDILNMATYKIDHELDESFNKHLILYYLHSLSIERYDSSNLIDLIQSDDKTVKSTKRLSFKVGDSAMNDISSLKFKYNFRNRTDILKSIILKINDDIVQNPTPTNIEDLRSLATAFSG
ncbi:hypothetical protein MX824_004886 [Vibrio parahaemolyticus]|uniref:hypothetical protein n=1 Tax=Vibrio parahaemolyticus TaxID=670 RepID=UPI000676F63F|nr:hypothetical protein [Vibrio parahaemolyticus]EJC6766209.1 hypothetical protein [Vibrio parahaemolyticus]EJC6785004.1 hypothetical protein [Vibrio parahaemolyticus]EJC6813354.1 hypothetical protein [Vibrio parahaemolyticus]EJC6928003.1 hypothetical protein [Vibrio parahaemolyticus]EJC6942344.1 hypothetical protein [Vibrio parahaemolyticus]